MSSNGARPERVGLTDAISAAMVELHAEFYAHDRTVARTFINDKIVGVACELFFLDAPIEGDTGSGV